MIGEKIIKNNKKKYLLLTLFVAIILWGSGAPKVFAKKDVELADRKYNRALLLMESNPALAMKGLNAAKELNPNDPKIYVAIGQMYFQQKNFKEAIKAFEKSISLNKDYAVAYSNLGYVYMSLKEWDKAIQNFRIILKYPNLTAPHYVYNAIGWAYYEKNEFKKSIAELKKAIQLKNNYSIAYYNLGLSLLGLGNFDQAIMEFENALKYQPDLTQAHNQLALIYLKKNMKKEARKKFEKVIELAPDSQMAKEAKNYLDILVP